ncbi:MAG: hypothetical protein ACFFDN_21585 [Candidatus Hodarchaeota archaeon]
MEQEKLQKRIEQLEKDKEKLLNEIQKLKRKPKGKIGYILLTMGTILLVLAVIYSHKISAFIGIALTFWGALFLYLRPTSFIRKEILDAITTERLSHYMKILEELGYKGTPKYVFPSTLWGLRNTVIYIPKSDNLTKPTDDQLSSDRVFIDNPKAIKLIPPGQCLSRLIEEEMKTNFSTVNLDYLKHNLEKVLVEGLEIANSFQMEISESKIHVEIKGTVFDQVLQGTNETKKEGYIGDPLNSAIACILLRSIRHPIIIEDIYFEPKGKIVKTNFKIIE